MAESISAKKNAAAVANFLAAQLHTRDEVFADLDVVPAAAGAYGWWFRSLPEAVDATGCEVRDGLTLLHVGISPTPPPASSEPAALYRLRL